MRPSFKNVHLRFRLNGLYFNREDLKEVAYSLVKEGVPYEQAIGDFLMDWLNEKDELEVQTSGTTGTPKIIKLKKHHMVNSAIATGDFFGISVGDKALHCLPSNFIAGKMMLIRALILGLEIDTVMPSSTPLKGLPYKEYDFSAMIPLQVKNSLNELARIKTLIIGGAAVSEPLMKDLQKLPVKAYETYGMTETITHVAAKSLNASSKTDTFKGLPGVNFASDDRNCLLIDAKEVSDNKIQTNDIVEIVSKSEFKWLGRYDTIINSGGIKLIPEQIELKLQHIISNRFFVAGKDDELLGQKLILIVEGDPDSKEEFQTMLKKNNALDKFETPKEVYIIAAFKETSTRKIARKIILDELLKD